MGTILVGVDGSESSKRALAWAVERARLSGADVRAVYAWLPSVPPAAVDAIAQHHPDVDVAKEAKALLADAVAGVVGEGPDVRISQDVARSSPANALIDASRDAELLVVGSRGMGGFRGLLLGSVSQQCAQHASCPVVIVPGAAERGTG